MKKQLACFFMVFLVAKHAQAENYCTTGDIQEKLICLSNKLEKLSELNSSLMNSLTKIQGQIENNSVINMPAGSVVAYAGTNIPEGWLLCDGRYFLTSAYPNLYRAIGRLYGGYAGYFNIPDYRGMFLRGVSGNRNDQFSDFDKLSRIGGDRVGSLQLDAIKKESNTAGLDLYKNTSFRFLVSNEGKKAEKQNAANSEVNILEIRPKNIYVYYIIKY